MPELTEGMVIIYDIRGRIVKTLISGSLMPGHYSAVWDGKNQYGSEASSGIYIARFTSPGYERTIKMVLIR